jgi:subtilisin family serine protease
MKVLFLIALLVAVAFADIAPLLHADSKNIVEGSYIIVLHENVTVLQRDSHVLKIKDLIFSSKDGSEVASTFNIGTVIGYSAKFSPELLAYVRKLSDVKYVEVDQVVSLNYQVDNVAPNAIVTQTGATWGINRISTRALNLNGNYAYNALGGEGVDAFIIDTGIYVEHSEFSQRATFAFSAITGETNTDGNGHGTHVAGTVGGVRYGVAKNVRLYAVKVLGANGSGTTAGVISGINYVTNSRNKARKSVANMSLGGGASATLDSAVAASITDGVAYGLAAGNDNSNACNTSPARTPSAITVGATTNTDARATYSNIGTCVTLFAPGTSITSAWIGSTTATNTISGTSMATPHVVGALAIQRSVDTAATPVQLKSWITSLATPNVVTGPGTGSPNLLLYSPLPAN